MVEVALRRGLAEHQRTQGKGNGTRRGSQPLGLFGIDLPIPWTPNLAKHSAKRRRSFTAQDMEIARKQKVHSHGAWTKSIFSLSLGHMALKLCDPNRPIA